MVKIVVIEEESDQFAKKLKQCLDDDMVPQWETKTTLILSERHGEPNSAFPLCYEDHIIHTMVLVDYEGGVPK